MKARNSSIELLRILLELGIIVLHYNNGSMGKALAFVAHGSMNEQVLYLLENIFICAVDLFVIISAYYLSSTSKRKISKIVELYFEMVFVNLLYYFIGPKIGIETSQSIGYLLVCFLPNNWFFILYSILYLISPYLNIIIEKLDKKEYKKLLILLFVIFSVWTHIVDYLSLLGDFKQMSSIGLFGNQDGYTIVNFVLLYMIGGYIKKFGINISKVKIISIFTIALIVNQILSLKLWFIWNYNNPLVILMAVLVFLFFNQIEFHSVIINILSKSAFTSYLINERLIRLISPIIYIQVNQTTSSMLLSILVIAISIYLIAYVVHLLFRLLYSYITL